jgi:hypothetical protein
MFAVRTSRFVLSPPHIRSRSIDSKVFQADSFKSPTKATTVLSTGPNAQTQIQLSDGLLSTAIASTKSSPSQADIE